jgi:hypothetical protein
VQSTGTLDGMGEVVDLFLVRQRCAVQGRYARLRHPALRWCAGDVYYLAHDRDPDSGVATCGAPGSLMLAPPGVPLCVRCWPTDLVEDKT